MAKPDKQLVRPYCGLFLYSTNILILKYILIKLAIIKNQLRNPTNQDRLVSISLNFFKKVDFEKIDKFAICKARRIVL